MQHLAIQNEPISQLLTFGAIASTEGWTDLVLRSGTQRLMLASED